VFKFAVQSQRKATIGSTLVADLAGRKVATSSTRISNSVTNTNVTGSCGPTLNSRLESTRDPASANSNPRQSTNALAHHKLKNIAFVRT